ncbi:DUF4855 domain-containing protein [Paenibacillus alvei]|uniref:DUF4855 domain-containing protein n=1 Tax=Paenibacillus alvei TaxID=44250 RepID=UPI002DDD501A|nr:DUF4855 domain-containing protein [Paenibacillus alvei]
MKQSQRYPRRGSLLLSLVLIFSIVFSVHPSVLNAEGDTPPEVTQGQGDQQPLPETSTQPEQGGIPQPDPDPQPQPDFNQQPQSDLEQQPQPAIEQPLDLAAATGYFPPNTAASGNVKNMALLYTGYYGGRNTYEGKEIGTYDKNTLLPYVAHYNSNNVMDDTFFDSFLFLGINTPDYRDFGDSADPAKFTYKTDWEWYINRIFTANQQLDALNQATQQVAATLNQPNYKSKVYIMIPYPNSRITNFGDVDNDGISENLKTNPGNLTKVTKWYIDTVRSKWNQAQYSNLELKGFYWFHEDIDTGNQGEVNAINNTGNYLHSLGLKYCWIPYFGAGQSKNAHNYTFDFSIQQPNHYFVPSSDYSRMTAVTTQAQTYNQGIEMEFDERAMSDPDFKNRFDNYVKAGAEYGYMTGAIKGWYQDIFGIYNFYKNKNNNGVSGIYDGRQMYEDIYKFTKGTYTIPGNLASGKTAVASSSQSSSVSADKAVDNKFGTRWSSQQYTNTEWIYVDLGQAYNVNRVKLNWETAYGKSYKIQVSNDATNWTDVYATTTGDGGVDDIGFVPTTARYVRMYATERGTIYGYSLYEFQVYGDSVGSATTANLALNKTASSSSNQDATLTPSNVVDGNATTRWSSQFTDSEWVTVDLGQSYNINRVLLNWELAYGKGYKIQVSNDATNWTDVYTTTTGDGGIDDIFFTPVNARYVRMYGTQRAYTFYGYSLYEFQVYGSKPNLALNKTATASSNETAAYTADKAVDGNPTTRWSSLYSNPQWIYVDLGQQYRVNQVKLNWEFAYAKGYRIQVSNDALNWADMYTTSTGDGGIDDIYFEPVNARYVRMYATNQGTDYWYSLYEFEVYGN